MSNLPPNDFDFFSDPTGGLDDPNDFTFDDNELGDFTLDDQEASLPEEEGESGVSRVFIILGVLLAVIFVILAGVFLALFLSQSDEPSPQELLATQIVATNQAIETEVSANETRIAIDSTATAERQIILNATATQEAVVAVTQTFEAQETAVAVTQAAQAFNATQTQAAALAQEISATQTALAQASPTVQLARLEGRLIDPETGQGAQGVVICIFQDDGDGQFNPSENTIGNCSPVAAIPATPESGTGGAQPPPPATSTPVPTTPSVTNPIFLTATAAAGGGNVPPPPTQEEANPVPGNTPAPGGGNPPPLNPIFLTATAAAGGGNVPPSPAPGSNPPPLNPIFQTATAAAGGSSSNGREISQRRIAERPESRSSAQQGDGGDELVVEVTTDSTGRFIIPPLPEGTYFIKIADQTLPITVTTEPQLLVIPVPGGAPIEIEVAGASQPRATPTLNPVLQTATALAANQGGQIVPPTVTPEGAQPTPQGQLPDTGLFDGQGGGVNSTDLAILGLIGAVLAGVVFAARRLRTA